MLAVDFIRNSRINGLEVRVLSAHAEYSFMAKDDGDPWLESLFAALGDVDLDALPADDHGHFGNYN